MQKKSVRMLILFLFFITCYISKLHASEIEPAQISKNKVNTTQVNTTPIDTSEIMNKQIGLFNWEEIENVQESLKQDSEYLKNFDLEEEVKQMITGEKRFNITTLLEIIGDMFLSELKNYIHIAIRFVLIVFLCSMLQTLSSAFESKNTTKVAFFVCYMVIIYSVLQSVVLLVDLANNVINHLSKIMAVTLPTLLAFMTTSGYITSSTALMPIIVGALNLCAFILQKLILPMIVGVVILQVISSMSEEIKVDKLVDLFYSGTKFTLKAIVFLSIGIMGIYRAVLPAVDIGIKKGAIEFSAAFIPVIGDVANSAINFVVLCAQQIKNSFAIGVILWIIVIVGMPLIKMFTYVCLYKIVGALIQPIGDKKMANIATNLAKGCQFIMSCTGSVAILCILAMLICISVGSSLI